MTLIADNIKAVRERIAKAAENVGSPADSVTLIAVSKTIDADRVREAIAAGATELGENYVQEAESKWLEIGNAANWHFIGHLQRNKAKSVVQFAKLIHSVDSLELAREIGKRAEVIGKVQDVLIEVKISVEATKFGVEPDEALDFAEQIAGVSGLRVQGFMGMAPFLENPKETRPYFSKLKTLWDKLPQEQRKFLSMGMTADFEVAIEEGSNMVRIGTAIFGPRKV